MCVWQVNHSFEFQIKLCSQKVWLREILDYLILRFVFGSRALPLAGARAQALAAILSLTI